MNLLWRIKNKRDFVPAWWIQKIMSWSNCLKTHWDYVKILFYRFGNIAMLTEGHQMVFQAVDAV